MPEIAGEPSGVQCGPAMAAGVDDEVDPHDMIPLNLLRSQRIPPAPNRRQSAIDWLPDYAGFSWIAYGASSLAVIAHCVSPHIAEETKVGSFFQQVIAPPVSDPPGPSLEVNAVAWCHSSPSDGYIAIGRGSKVEVHSPDTGVPGSLRWQHVVHLSHSSTVEAICWTMSGDGLISVGTEITFWKRSMDFWELTIKLGMEVPQRIVATTWSLNSPVASAASVAQSPLTSSIREIGYTSPSFEAIRHVLVCQNNGKSGPTETKLSHPQPVSFIQWRPLNIGLAKRHPNYLQRNVLLTSCFDGVVRLWSKIDGGKSRKVFKDIENDKSKAYHVIAAIEINQCLKAALGTDVFVSWGTETYGAISIAGAEQRIPAGNSNCNQTGICEWLVGVGPSLSLTFWALHCLDDIAPLRFPRVTLWKKHDKILHGRPTHVISQSVLIKAVMSRNELYSPPNLCCLLQLLPNNSISWLQLYDARPDAEDIAQFPLKDSLSSFIISDQSVDGHEGTILHVAVHPCSEVDIVVSMDSNGILLFWSISSISTFPLGVEPLPNAAWKLLGRVGMRELSSDVVEYSSLAWVPSVFGKDMFLLLGHVAGIDCYLLKFSDMENEDMIFNRMFTVPFSSTTSPSDGPYKIFAFLLASNCRQPLVFNHFMIFAVWEKEFQVLSWDVTMHAENVSENTCSNPDFARVIASSMFKCMSSCIDWMFDIKVKPCSRFPVSHNSGHVTSYTVVSSDFLIPSVNYGSSSDELCSLPYFYHIATGHSDGSLRFWRMNYGTPNSKDSDISCLRWELVGQLTSHQDPVHLISWSNCGSKLATVCLGMTGSSSMLHIWVSMSLVSGGCFLLGDTIPMHSAPLALHWLQLGNGQLLLGVCMHNELQIYTQLRVVGNVSSKLERSVNPSGWSCIAVCQSDTSITDFIWGPKATPVLIHKKYFSLFSHWSMKKEMHDTFRKDRSPIFTNDQREDRVECISTISGNSNVRQSIQNDERDGTLLTVRDRSVDSHRISSFDNTELQKLFTSANSVGMNNILSFCESYCGSLPVYHPKALVLYLYSGKSKRAYASLLHLTEYIRSMEIPTDETRSGKSEKSPSSIPEICLSKYFEEVPMSPAWTKGTERSNHANPSDKHLLGTFFHLVGENSLAYNSFDPQRTTSQQHETRSLKDVLLSLQHVIPLHFEEKIQMFAIVDLLGECCDPQYSSTYDSFDEPGKRFWTAARLTRLHFHQKVGRPAAADELSVESWMIAWAYHSDCQENLFNSVISPEPTWKELRNMGVGYWLTSVSQLRRTMEKLARSQYVLKKDPKDCALLYLALNRLQVLAGLFRLSKDERDKPLVGFLSRNFQEEKNKAAALKNAYVLLGRHQLELAVAFFLLGGDHSSAVTVCAKNLGDEQLALVICRLVEGFGGPLERQLISGTLLPNAYDRGDCWLSSLFEWALGNCSLSVKALTKAGLNSPTDCSNFLHSPAISDPNIGQYCRMLASKNSMRIAIGDVIAVELSKWATEITAKALQTCGVPLEALDCVSSCLSNLDVKDETRSHGIPEYDALFEILNLGPKTADSVCNWFSGNVARSLESRSLLNSAMQYVSKLLLDFPDWQVTSLVFPALLNKEHDDTYINRESHKTNSKLKMGMLILQNKFSVNPNHIINMILIYAYNHGMMFPGYNTLRRFTSVYDNCNAMDEFLLQCMMPRMLSKATKELSDLFVKFMLYHSITDSIIPSDAGSDVRYFTTILQLMTLSGIINMIWSLRNFAKLHVPSSLQADKFLEESEESLAFDHLLLFSFFGFTWFARSLKGMFLAIYSILRHLDKGSFHEMIGDSITNFSSQNCKAVLKDIDERLFSTCNNQCQGSNGFSPFKFDNETWLLLGTSLLKRLHDCMVNELKRLKHGTAVHPETLNKPEEMSDFHLANIVALSEAHVFLMLKKHFLSILWQKMEKGIPMHSVFELEESTHFKDYETSDLVNQASDLVQLLNHEDVKPLLFFLTKFLLKPEELCQDLLHKDLECRNQPCGFWDDINNLISSSKECKEFGDSDVNRSAASTASSAKPDMLSLSGISDRGYFEGARVKYPLEGSMFFQTPKDIYKKSGDLVEAICFNHVDEQQVVLASNQKGMLYFNIDFEQPVRHQDEYIWGTSDWPREGWAESDVTAAAGVFRSNCRSGVSDAATRSGSLARPGRDMTGGGAFGIPGYAGIGASGFGWSVHDDFDEFIDVPSTLANVSPRAVCSHPSRPLFLVGSSNTQVYLWEFGKEKATATYGVLPVFSGLPPYTLASIAALHFDYYGQRFATAAIDGTVCTWQLEVGGNSNVYPAESSQCFNNHTWDLAYISSAGSVIAAAGYNSNNVNVVIWDTLAPPATSQASLVCHEGGARSISVLDTGIGCGSVSPIIVTGGKNGDVGLYDFRFVATGRMRRNRNFSEQTLNSLSLHGANALALKSVDSSNGMLWAIPKAHTGSITKISAIPNSNLFLTGSKDGDVKLWDAQKSQLVAHWPKLHEKHTFLQPSSGNFGGIVRAAVTDIRVHPRGFLTCGGDGLVKFVRLKKFQFPS